MPNDPYKDREVEVLAKKSIVVPKNTIYLHLPNSLIWTDEESIWKGAAPKTWKVMKAAFGLDISHFGKPFVIDSRAFFWIPEGEIAMQATISIADAGREILVIAKLLADADDDAENYVTSLEDSISGYYRETEDDFTRFIKDVHEIYADVLNRLVVALMNFHPDPPAGMRPI